MLQIGHLSWIDLLVIISLLLGITVFAHFVSGTVKDQKGFFTASGKMHWLVVSFSIIATTLSAISIVAVPAMVFKDGGNLTYAQALFGMMVATVLTALLFAKPYYECREAATTYDYIGLRTDRRVGLASMGIGLASISLDASVQLLSAGLVLSVIMKLPIFVCIFIVVFTSVVWAWMAGIKTIIWTDCALFITFFLGAIFSAIWSFVVTDLTLVEAFHLLDEKGKLVIIDLSTDPTKAITLWAGLVGATSLQLSLASYQGTMQRVRACRSVADAKKAFMSSAIFHVVPFFMLIVGLGLTVFYDANPLPAEMVESLRTEPDRIFPFFIITEIPTGLSSLFIAAILAAAISTLDSRLAAMSHVVVSDVYQRYINREATESHYLLASRLGVLCWGVIFGLIAFSVSGMQVDGLLNLVFELPSYLYGSVLGALLLARLGVGTLGSFMVGLLASLISVVLLDFWDVSFWWWPFVAAIVMVVVVWPLSGEKPEWGGVEVIER